MIVLSFPEIGNFIQTTRLRHILFLESLICRRNQLKRRQRQGKLLLKCTGSNNAVKATLNPSAFEGSSVENFFGSDRLHWKQPQTICFFLTLFVRGGRMKRGHEALDRSSHQAGKTLHQVSCSSSKIKGVGNYWQWAKGPGRAVFIFKKQKCCIFWSSCNWQRP